MTKILTIHNQTLTGEHWFKRGAYGRAEITSIADPDGGATKKMPTSIPSPFSQFDLVKTAFRHIVNSGFGEETPLDFRLVSHTLDVGELFFNLKKFKNKIDIIPWSKNDEIGKLKNSRDEGHKKYGEVLQLFLDQDSDTYNFEDLDRLFILKYNAGIVGGTSPATLFFASPNDLSFAQLQMPNNDILFDDNYCHLFDRDKEYQLFWFALQKALPNFGNRFKELNDYLDKCIDYWASRDRGGFYREILAIDGGTYINKYDTASTNNGVGLEILGYPLRVSKEDGNVVRNSDFEIDSSKIGAGKKPLVLVQNHPGKDKAGNSMTYWGGALSNNVAQQIPHRYSNTDTSLDNRELPGIAGVTYPFILIGDFLEPYLIRLVYPINKKCFFNGGINNPSKEYILPIKKEFFEYFDISDLMNRNMWDGKPMYEMNALPGDAIEVILRIPIKNDEYITYSRMYYDKQSPVTSDNKGGIVEHQFGLNIFPFVDHLDAVTPDYRIMLVDRDLENANATYNLSFFDGNANEVPLIDERDKRKKNSNKGESGSKYFLLNRSFKFIEVDIINTNTITPDKRKGIIIPLFQNNTVNKNFRFVIDFGTTNTHIEYTVDSSIPKPFEITESDIQVGTLHDHTFAKEDPSLNGSGATDIISFIDDEFVPLEIQKGKMASFPQRTVISESTNINFGSNNFVIGDFNIPFSYERRPLNKYKITANLKWQNFQMNAQSKRRVEAFFEKLLFMIKAKVLLNEGLISQTEIIWTYPSSMTTGKLNSLKQLWEDNVQKYLGIDNCLNVSESIAPYYHYKAKGVYAGNRPAVNIDIGGGTTDIVAFIDNQPKLLTSFRYAANSIFGDGFGYGGSDSNGFVQKYQSKINQLLETNNLYDLRRVSSELDDKKNSIDIIAFFFSLEENPDVAGRGLPINFSDILKEDDDMRFVFLVFYTSIIYHTANLMKKQGLLVPRYITLSGRGSKVFEILSRNETLEEFAKLIFNKVYNINDLDDLTIETEKMTPKEVTCKGALLMNNASINQFAQPAFIKSIKVVSSGVTDDLYEPETYEEINNNRVEYIKSIRNEVNEFITFLFSLHQEFNFNDEFSVAVSKLEDYENLLRKDIDIHLQQGINQKIEELNGDLRRPLDETMFFYHFIPAINKLARFIQQSN